MTMRISDENKEKLQAVLKARGLKSLDEVVEVLIDGIKPKIQVTQLKWDKKIWELPLEFFGYVKEEHISPAIYVAFKPSQFTLQKKDEEYDPDWIKFCIRDSLNAIANKLAELKTNPFRRPFFVGRIKRNDGEDSLVIWSPWQEDIKAWKQNL